MDKIKIGRTVYTILTSFISLQNEKLYVGTAQNNYGLYKHVILQENNGKWLIHI